MERTPDQEYLLEILTYNPENGELHWKYRPAVSSRWNSRYSGKIALNSPTRGYMHGTIGGKRFFAHRVIWKMIHGKDPETIDHINGNRSDNRIENLRDVSKATNLKNRCMSRHNKSGYNGVCFHKASGKWLAYTRDHYKQINLGLYKTVEEAAAARAESDKKIGYHPNHGRPFHPNS